MKNKEYVGVEDNSKDILHGIMATRWLSMSHSFLGIDATIEEICNK